MIAPLLPKPVLRGLHRVTDLREGGNATRYLVRSGCEWRMLPTHFAVDADGRLLMVRLTPADIADSTGALPVLKALKQRWPWVKHLFAEGAYDRRQLLDKAAFLDFVVEVVRRLAGQ